MRIFSLSLMLSLLVSATLLVGCQGETIAPVTTGSVDLSPMGLPVKNDRLILLDIPPIAEIQSNRSDTVLVKPGGVTRLLAILKYISVDDRLVALSAVFTIPQNAIKEPVTISIGIDPSTGSIHFQPAGFVFEKPASLDFFTRNIDPFPENTLVQFVYLGPDSTTELITFESLRTMGQSGKIDMLGARIGHFSRYAFAR